MDDKLYIARYKDGTYSKSSGKIKNLKQHLRAKLGYSGHKIEEDESIAQILEIDLSKGIPLENVYVGKEMWKNSTNTYFNYDPPRFEEIKGNGPLDEEDLSDI